MRGSRQDLWRGNFSSLINPKSAEKILIFIILIGQGEYSRELSIRKWNFRAHCSWKILLIITLG